MSEEEIINILSDEIVSLNVGHEKYEQAVKGLLDLYNKEKEKNKELKREKEINIEWVLKIKAKIEELEKECKYCEFGKFLCKHCFVGEGKKLLNSLLEKE